MDRPTPGESDVVVNVRGGVADLVRKPAGVAVEVRDYDTEGCTPQEMALCATDEEGCPYFRALFERGERFPRT